MLCSFHIMHLSVPVVISTPYAWQLERLWLEHVEDTHMQWRKIFLKVDVLSYKTMANAELRHINNNNNKTKKK